jgi:hypothetical protein
VGDGGDRQVETRCTELLRILTPVSNAALLEGADHLCQHVTLLGLVQSSLAKLP